MATRSITFRTTAQASRMCRVCQRPSSAISTVATSAAPIIKDKLFFFGGGERISRQNADVASGANLVFASHPAAVPLRFRLHSMTRSAWRAWTTTRPTTSTCSCAVPTASTRTMPLRIWTLPNLPEPRQRSRPSWAALTWPPATSTTPSVSVTRSSTTCWLMERQQLGYLHLQPVNGTKQPDHPCGRFERWSQLPCTAGYFPVGQAVPL